MYCAIFTVAITAAAAAGNTAVQPSATVAAISAVISAVASIIAIGVSVFNYFHVKKLMYVNTISAQRINWVIDVRTLVTKFINQYLTAYDPVELKKLYSGIELYLNIEENLDDLALHNVLEKYCATGGLEPDELIINAKKSLTSAWIRMRIEAGSSKRYNKKITKKLNQLPFENKQQRP